MHDVHAPPRLLPLLRSPFQGELLAWLYLHPGEEYSATEMGRRFGVSQPTASREADRLAAGEPERSRLSLADLVGRIPAIDRELRC